MRTSPPAKSTFTGPPVLYELSNTDSLRNLRTPRQSLAPHSRFWNTLLYGLARLGRLSPHHGSVASRPWLIVTRTPQDGVSLRLASFAYYTSSSTATSPVTSRHPCESEIGHQTFPDCGDLLHVDVLLARTAVTGSPAPLYGRQNCARNVRA
jgi:hypothetical protein